LFGGAKPTKAPHGDGTGPKPPPLPPTMIGSGAELKQA